MPLPQSTIQRIAGKAYLEASLHFNPVFSKDQHTACKACYTAGAEKEAERAQEIIDQYKKICEIAGVPKLLIDNPNLINGQLPTDEQIRKSWETIKEWERQTKNSK